MGVPNPVVGNNNVLPLVPVPPAVPQNNQNPPPPAVPPKHKPAASATYDFFMDALIKDGKIPDDQYDKGMPADYQVKFEFQKDQFDQLQYTLTSKGGQNYVTLHTTFTLLDKNGNEVQINGLPVVKETALYTTFTLPPLSSRKQIDNALTLAYGVALPHALKLRGALNEGVSEIYGNDFSKRAALIKSVMNESYSSITFKNSVQKGMLLWKTFEEQSLPIISDGGYLKAKNIDRIVLHAGGQDFDMDAPEVKFNPPVKGMRSVDHIRSQHFILRDPVDMSTIDLVNREKLRVDELNQGINKILKDPNIADSDREDEINTYVEKELKEEKSGSKGDNQVTCLDLALRSDRKNRLDQNIKQFEKLAKYFDKPKKLDDLSKLYRSNLDKEVIKQITREAKRNPDDLCVLKQAIDHNIPDGQVWDDDSEALANWIDSHMNVVEDLEDLFRQMKVLRAQINADYTVFHAIAPDSAELRADDVDAMTDKIDAIEAMLNPRNKDLIDLKTEVAAHKQKLIDDAEKKYNNVKTAYDQVKGPADAAAKAASDAKKALEESKDASKNIPKVEQDRLKAESEQRQGEAKSLNDDLKEAQDALKEAENNFKTIKAQAAFALKIANDAKKDAIYSGRYDSLLNSATPDQDALLSFVEDWLSLPTRDLAGDAKIAEKLADKRVNLPDGTQRHIITSLASELDHDDFSKQLHKFVAISSKGPARAVLLSCEDKIFEELLVGNLEEENYKTALLALRSIFDIIKLGDENLLGIEFGAGTVYSKYRIDLLKQAASSPKDETLDIVNDWLDWDKTQRDVKLDQEIGIQLSDRDVVDSAGHKELFLTAYIKSLADDAKLQENLDILFSKIPVDEIKGVRDELLQELMQATILGTLGTSAKYQGQDKLENVLTHLKAKQFIDLNGVKDLAYFKAAPIYIQKIIEQAAT